MKTMKMMAIEIEILEKMNIVTHKCKVYYWKILVIPFRIYISSIIYVSTHQCMLLINNLTN
jgi:hypothetical protein